MENRGAPFAARKIPQFIPLSLLVSLLALSWPAWGREQKVLQKTATDPQVRAGDDYMNEGDDKAKNGALTTLQVQSLLNFDQRTIVRFDLSPALSAGIKSATITLFMSTVPSATRTYTAHRVTRLWHEPKTSWKDRAQAGTWATPGGEFNPTATDSVSTPATTGDMSWTITSNVQAWYSGTPNHGTLIKDSIEGVDPAFTGIFSSKEDATEANRPKLTLTFVQNVRSLTATPGNGSVTLSWSFPAVIGTVLEATTGTLILRKAGSPIAATTVPTDGTNPAVGSIIGDATVVFNDSTNATGFTDTTVVNGTTYFYKVFARDSANNYSANASSSALVPEIAATPSATAPEAPLWMADTGATTLAPPGLIPGTLVAAGSNSGLLVGLDASTGSPRIFPISTSGAISGRPPIIAAAVSSMATDMLYVHVQGDDRTYGLDGTTGELFWLDRIGNAAAPVGGAAVQMKSLSGASFILANDLVISGSRRTATTTGNRVRAVDGNTGGRVWEALGADVGPPAIPNMDIISSTPFVDLTNNVVWVTSRSAGGTAQPSLWKFGTNGGATLPAPDLQGTLNLGDIDSSPTLTPASDFLFLGNNAGTLFAINPATVTTITSFAAGDGAIKGFPVVLGFVSPFTVIFSTDTRVHAVSFDGTTFTSLWSTPISVPSTPISFTGLGKVYVGSSDGKIHQLNLSTGVDEAQRIVDTTATVGDLSLDVTLSRIYVGATNGRIFAFTFPF